MGKKYTNHDVMLAAGFASVALCHLLRTLKNKTDEDFDSPDSKTYAAFENEVQSWQKWIVDDAQILLDHIGEMAVPSK